jgi:hypothetical protein
MRCGYGFRKPRQSRSWHGLPFRRNRFQIYPGHLEVVREPGNDIFHQDWQGLDDSSNLVPNGYAVLQTYRWFHIRLYYYDSRICWNYQPRSLKPLCQSDNSYPPFLLAPGLENRSWRMPVAAMSSLRRFRQSKFYDDSEHWFLDRAVAFYQSVGLPGRYLVLNLVRH